jgi:thiol:disulfide interchange protein DsbA
MRRRVLRALALSGFALAVRPLRAVDLLEDLDYRVIPQQPLADPGRVEVVEFFYYGCRWCNEFEPYLLAWAERKPADVTLRYQPAIRSTRWIVLTKAFYAFQALGLEAKLRPRIYRAYHRDEVNLEDEVVLTTWALKQGVELKPFETLMQSDAIMAQVESARRATHAYQIETTPSVVVDGRYLTSSAMAGGVGELMGVVEELIALARQDRVLRR